LQIAEECMAENVRVFGSVARGDQRADSDVDFLVHMRPGAGLGRCNLYWKLEELLDCKVDVAADTHLHRFIKDQVLNEAVAI